MKLKYKLLDHGGFVAGDIDSGLTCYAYPTSVHATAAKFAPVKTAKAMINSQSWRGRNEFRTEYDARNWDLLGGRQ